MNSNRILFFNSQMLGFIALICSSEYICAYCPAHDWKAPKGPALKGYFRDFWACLDRIFPLLYYLSTLSCRELSKDAYAKETPMIWLSTASLWMRKFARIRSPSYIAWHQIVDTDDYRWKPLFEPSTQHRNMFGMLCKTATQFRKDAENIPHLTTTRRST
jgi:hypothetical protein